MKTNRINLKGSTAPRRAQAKRPNANSPKPPAPKRVSIALSNEFQAFAENYGLNAQQTAERMLRTVISYRTDELPPFRVSIRLPHDDASQRAIATMIALHPGLTREAIAEHIVSETLEQAAEDLDLLATCARSAHEQQKAQKAVSLEGPSSCVPADSRSRWVMDAMIADYPKLTCEGIVEYLAFDALRQSGEDDSIRAGYAADADEYASKARAARGGKGVRK